MRYGVVTPAHNEQDTLGQLHQSLSEQTLRPEQWVIVENGSADDTYRTAATLASEHAWIQARSTGGVGRSDRGAPVVRAIHEGMDAIGDDLDVVVVVDADVTFPQDYFERLMTRFLDDPRLGMASGTCYERVDGAWQERHVTGEHVWGASRAYRREVIPVVMPLEPRMGWDAIDQIKANIAGWDTATFKDLPFFHHRAEGTRDGAAVKARVNQGRASYYMGYRFSYLLLRTAFAARREPSALGLIWGYASAAAVRAPRCPDLAVRQHVRAQQSLGKWRLRLAEARGHR